MSQSKPKTPAERKALERKRKREQGLVLKQIWIPESASPILSDLQTQEAEKLVHDAFGQNGGSYGPDASPDVAYAYERASEILDQELAIAEIQVGREKSPQHVTEVIRAILKIYSPLQRAHPETVQAIRREIE